MNYTKFFYNQHRHHERYKNFINSMNKKLVYQECGGMGNYIEPVLDYGEGPTFSCGFCEGTGYLTPYMRGQWLKWKKAEKH